MSDRTRQSRKGHSTQTAVRYLDGSGLRRPMDMPKAQRTILIFFTVAAAIIGIWLGVSVYSNAANSAKEEAASIDSSINRGVTLDSPVLVNYVTYTDDELTQSFTDAGFTIFDLSTVSSSSQTEYNIIKLPSDITLADAAVAYSTGISNLSASQAAKYLSGSWQLTVNRDNGFEMKLRYADFSSDTADSAVASAMTTQQFSGATVTDSGVDSSGNTYQTGTVSIAGENYSWQVSACPLSYVYSNDGLPSSAQYVGVRIYQ